MARIHRLEAWHGEFQRPPQKVKTIVRLDTHRKYRLEVTCLIKCCMMALLNNARIHIQVDNVLISSCVPKEDTGEVMAAQFGTPIPRTFDTYP